MTKQTQTTSEERAPRSVSPQSKRAASDGDTISVLARTAPDREHAQATAIVYHRVSSHKGGQIIQRPHGD
jgi:hypothetical protein